MAHPDEPQRPLRRLAATAALGLGAALALFVAYLAVTLPGAWYSPAATRAWPAAELKLTDGTGALDGKTLVITAAGDNDTTVVALDTDFRSTDYPGIRFEVKGVPDNADVRLIWKSDVVRRSNLAQGVVEAGEVRGFNLARNPDWIGRIKGLALAIRAPLATPMRIEGVVARPLDAIDVTRERVGEWLAFEPFNGASINTITGGADAQDLPLPAIAAAAVLLAALIALGLGRFAPSRLGFGTACTLAGIFAAAWFIVDARWALNLARQTRVEVATYGGKTTDERHRAAEDGELYAFITRARALMPDKPVRVFVAAQEHYFRGRAAWHLYPENVQFEAFLDHVAPAAWMKPGDWLVVYHRRGIQYDAARKLLRWDGGPPVHAELKLLEAHGAALFLIDGPES